MKKYIPNALTLANLFCGCVAVLFIADNHFVYGVFFAFLGVFFDFFDGFFARKFNVQSDLGLQLDSLADMITSGFVPGLIMFKLLSLSQISWEADTNSFLEPFYNISGSSFLPFLGLAITLASAYRLANFNIDTEQQSFFKGLPTPANTLLIASLPLIVEYQKNDVINAIIFNTWFLLALTLLSCYILNAPVKLFALKFKTYNFKDNSVRYIFLILSVVLLVVLQFSAIPLIIIFYILISFLNNLTTK